MNAMNSSRTPPSQKVSGCGVSERQTPGPGCSSTPTSKRSDNIPSTVTHRRKVFQDGSPPRKRGKVCFSPLSHRSNDPNGSQASPPKEAHINSMGGSSGESTNINETVSVNIEFPHGGWDEDSSDEMSSCGLEIVESEAEAQSSPVKKKRKRTEICEEDSAILSGMGEEIERQLEAKAARNRLTVPNVKNILRSVITNPLVRAMVRKSIKTGSVAVSGDLDDFVYEPIITRAKAKQLLESVPQMTWAQRSDLPWGSPQKGTSSSACHTFISENLDDSEDDEEYKPFEDEPSDNDFSERDGSERGSERDISIDQSPAYFDADNESCPPTPSPSPKPNITDSATQTNWSEDGVFKVPQTPLEQHGDLIKEENIALRTRSKLPLNDTPLEEIEQAFIPPDITPDLYDTTCDNADWQEFLTEFMQPMRSESHANDDEEEDPEYNVLADEEIIDREELRMDKGVKVSKKELKELMKELLEFTENLSSDDEDKNMNKNRNTSAFNSAENQALNNSPILLHDDFSFLEAYMSMGTFTPNNNSKSTPQSTPTCHSGLNTPVPPISPPNQMTSNSGKKFWDRISPLSEKDKNLSISPTGGEVCISQVLKEQNQISSPEKKENCDVVSSEHHEIFDEGKQEFSSGKNVRSFDKSINNCSSKGKSRSPNEAKIKTIKRGSVERKTSHEFSVISEENCSVVPISPISHAIGATSSIHSISLKTPLKLEIQDLPTESIAHTELSSSLLQLSVTSHDNSKHDSVSLGETCSMTAPQRLLLAQQMRQHVQLLTQHYLQCYQHPVHNSHSASCKEHLFTLKYLGASKPISSFKSANLVPALELIELWENKLSSEEGSSIKSFWENEVVQTSIKKKLRHKHVADFPPQLKEAMANSFTFIYPDLLPPRPFILHDGGRWPLLQSEIKLIAHGFEQFHPYVMELYPKKLRLWNRLTISLIAEHLVTCKTERELYQLYRRLRARFKDNPIQRYLNHNEVPRTIHYVVPFDERQMKPLRSQPPRNLPKIWRDFIYPARD